MLLGLRDTMVLAVAGRGSPLRCQPSTRLLNALMRCQLLLHVQVDHVDGLDVPCCQGLVHDLISAFLHGGYGERLLRVLALGGMGTKLPQEHRAWLHDWRYCRWLCCWSGLLRDALSLM